MAINKVIYGGNTLIDLTADTVIAPLFWKAIRLTTEVGQPLQEQQQAEVRADLCGRMLMAMCIYLTSLAQAWMSLRCPLQLTAHIRQRQAMRIVQSR